MSNRPQPGLTAEVFALIQEHEELLIRPRQVWPMEQLLKIYAIYNAYTGEVHKPNGCGACATTKVQKVKQIYEEYKKTL